MQVNLPKAPAYLPFISAVAVCLGSFVMGYSLVAISLLQQEITSSNHISIQQSDLYISLATTALPLGAIIGCSLLKWMCDRYGQGRTLYIIDLLAIFASVIQMMTLQIYPLLISRFLIGVYCGINSGIVPVYITSLSPPHLVGVLGTLNQLLITIGISLAYYFDSISESLVLPGLEPWQVRLGLPAVYAAARIIFLQIANMDTLERHYQNNQLENINRYLEIVYKVTGEEHLKALIAVKNLNKNPPSGQKSNASTSVFRLAVVIAIANQMSGINAILFYANQLFSSIKSSSLSPKDCVLYLGVFQVVITIISSLLIDRAGRRTLMLFGQSIVAGSLIFGWVFVDFVPGSQTTVILLIFLHIMGFSLSLGPVSMVYISEIMTNLTPIVLLLWGLTFGVSLISELMITILGIGKVFLFYGVISITCLAYLSSKMVESKNKNRVQLVNEIDGKMPPYNEQKKSGIAESTGLLSDEQIHN